MPRPQQRACLQDGLKLDLNRLIRRGTVQPGFKAGPHLVQWSNSYTGQPIASGFITADMTGSERGWFRFQSQDRDEWTDLVACERHFGGRQWYFICPVTDRRVSVLWKPPGASQFCSRQRWGAGMVAYRSQFLDADNRAHAGQAKIKSRLIGDLDPQEWDLPPKPKWIRWSTYNEYARRYDRYEAILDDGIADLAAKLGKNFF